MDWEKKLAELGGQEMANIAKAVFTAILKVLPIDEFKETCFQVYGPVDDDRKEILEALTEEFRQYKEHAEEEMDEFFAAFDAADLFDAMIEDSEKNEPAEEPEEE